MSRPSNPEPEFLTVANVIALHAFVMEHLGAVPEPLRDEGLLESAVMRPRMAWHYEQANIIRMASLLAVGISQAQAFVDGNKRTAYLCTEVFHDTNGYQFNSDPKELAHQLEAVASRSDDLDAATERFEAWLRANVGPRST